MNSYERIYAVVRSIPRGTVATYGQVARLAGNPRWARVVDRNGCTSSAFAFGGSDIQKALLEADGIPFLPDGRVDLAACQWNPDQEIL